MAGFRAEMAGEGARARDVLARLAEAGARGVRLDATMHEIRPRELDRSGRRDLASLLGRLGLRFAGVDCFVPPEHYSEVSRAERAMMATAGAIELCAELAGLCGGRAGRTVSLTVRPVDREVIENVREQAERAGVRIGLCVDPTEAGEVLDETIGVCFDAAGSVMRGRDVGQDVLGAGARLVCARLSDTDGFTRVRPGEGRLDLGGYAAALIGAGYREEVALDMRGVNDQRGAIEQAIDTWEATGLGTR